MTTAIEASPRKTWRPPAPEQALKNETEAAKMLLAHLAALDADGDEEVVRDSIEGETNLFEALSEAVKQYGEDMAAVEALKAYTKELKGRSDRIEARTKRIKVVIGIAMTTAGQKSKPTPFGTVSARPGEPEVIVTEEADVPVQFWVTPPPVQPDPYIDMKALKEALKTLPKEERCTYAHLSEPKTIVSIRRK